MKLSTAILITIIFTMLVSVLASNLVLKVEYNKVDKADIYWNYRKVNQQPFHYLKIEGGNITNIVFEQSKNYSVRLLREWSQHRQDLIKTSVKNDTLYIKFIYNNKNIYEKLWMAQTTLVRIFSPELLFIEGYNTKLKMFQLSQNNIRVKMSGRSSFEIESAIPVLDSLAVEQHDSSQVVIEMAEDLNNIHPPSFNNQTGPRVIVNGNNFPATKSQQAMNIHSVQASLSGNSILDIGHAQVQSLQLDIADSSAIILSGGALKKFKL